jgi:tetratricopeptide (TPR) repeat protein
MRDLPAEHDRLYLAATALLKRDNILNLSPPVSPNWFVRRRVRKAIALLGEVVQLNPKNWAAHWVTGKAHQALGQNELALDCFSRSRLLNENHPDVAREAAISAMECGRHDLSIEFTRAALKLRPGDAGLQANLGLAHLFAGEPQVARRVIDAALESDPNDKITKTISRIVNEVLAGKRPCPKRRSDILSRPTSA